jgi:hypothetical protein
MDFGRGIVPIHVFDEETDESGQSWIWFVEHADLELIVRAPGGERVEVQAYRVSRDVVRFAEGSEYESAVTRYGELRRTDHRVIPEALRVGSPHFIPTDLAAEEARKYLRLVTHPQVTLVADVMSLGVRSGETADLIPAFI